jgi:YidC/Oxa1 family membrane protein insertase
LCTIFVGMSLWFTILYQPLLNALIWTYTNYANQNLAWAVIIMTVALRLALVPFSLVSEKNEAKRRLLEQDGKKLAVIYKNDPVAQQEELRKIMKKNHISPWARFFTLVVQVLLFVVLYQVFINGVQNDEIMKDLYPGVSYPGKLNTLFFGFDISKNHTVLWAGFTAAYILVSTLVEGVLRKKSWEKSDVYFLIFFPLSIFVGLWFLPMVKSIFLLTTVVFSDIIKALFSWLQREKKTEHDTHNGHAAPSHH